jgi:hypothetical protein
VLQLSKRSRDAASRRQADVEMAEEEQSVFAAAAAADDDDEDGVAMPAARVTNNSNLPVFDEHYARMADMYCAAPLNIDTSTGKLWYI